MMGDEDGGGNKEDKDHGMVETQIVRLVVRIFPVVHKDFKGLGRVISIIGLPGVNIAKCLQRVTDPRFYDQRHGEIGRSREALWKEVVHSEFRVLEAQMRHDDMEGRLCDFDNYHDYKHHVFHLCSEAMIVKKLLNLVSAHLISLGLQGYEECKNVSIPGLANPVDSRVGSVDANTVKYDKALTFESKAIMAWIRAFNICRAHHIMSISSPTKSKPSGGASGGGDDAVTNDNDGTDNQFGAGRLEYYLPCVWRPVVTGEQLPEFGDEEVIEQFSHQPMLARFDRTLGFQEAAVTMVCRPVVSEDFYLDFNRGFDIGAFPPLVRIVLLDFVIGCSDPDVAECVLSDADLVPLTTLGRQHRFFSRESNCMDTYIRQDVYGAWKAGFEKHQETMKTMNSTGPDRLKNFEVVKLMMQKADFYVQQAIQFHCSNISDNVYRSEIMTHVYEMYTQLKGVVGKRINGNMAMMGKVKRPTEWNSVDSTTKMRLLFYRALLEFNITAHMSYTNIAIVTELFTTMTQWFIHPGNVTWSNWLIPIQVVPQKAQLFRTYHRDGQKSICVDKPNSTGVDEVVCRAFDGCNALCNCEVTRSDGRALDLAMCKAGRETPVARERRNKVMICKNVVIAEPDPSLVNRLQSSTEERNLNDADLDSKIRVTPRNRTTIRDGTVFTTDTNDKGTRESQRWEPVGGYHIGVQATNCQIATIKNQEQWETNLVATKCMSTGRDQDRKRSRSSRSDFIVNHASGTSQSVRDIETSKQLSSLLCFLPHVSGCFLGYMNKLGFTGIEICPMTQMYMDYLVWRFDSLFSRLVGVRLSKSFQRTCQGHYGRHISDYVTARFTLEVAKQDSFDKAMATTINVLSYNCLPVAAVPTWMDDAMREGVDGQLLVLHNVVSQIISVPYVSLAWLMKALMPYDSLSDADRDYVDNHEDAMKIARWVKRLVDNDCFLYEQTVTGGGAPAQHGGAHGLGVYGGANTAGQFGGGGGGGQYGQYGASETPTVKGVKRFHPYITTSSTASEEKSYLRAKTKTKGYAEEIAKKIVKHPEMVSYSKNTGFTVDDKVLKCMVDRVSHLSLGLENAFGTPDLCNPNTLFALSKRKLGNNAVESPISAEVLSNTTEMQDPSYGMISTINDGDSQNIIFGVNITLAVILTSMVEGNSLSNSQIDERMSKSVMALMMRDIPMQFLGQDCKSYLRKNFRGNCPSNDFNNVDIFHEARPQYVCRPVHDHEKELNRITHFPCNIISGSGHAPEDCAHMAELCALVRHYKADKLLDISLTHATPRYMFMFDTCYPVSFTREGLELEKVRMKQPGLICVTGYLFIQSPKTYLTNSGAANTTPWKIVFDSYHNGFHDITGDDVWDIDEALAKRHAIVLPLIRRHNAVVFLTGTTTFGVVQPNYNAPRPTNAGDSYFGHEDATYGYSAFMENTPTGTTTQIHPLLMNDAILPLASNIWIRADVYYLCRGQNPNHADCMSAGTNGSQMFKERMYVRAVVSYPSFYPSKASHHTSIFAEIAYAGVKGSGQTSYHSMEINLEALRDANMYIPSIPGAKMSPPPICIVDPRTFLGDDISIVTFTSGN
jgi:hypothetical protein